MNRNILNAIGKIDPRYIEEAACVQNQTEGTTEFTKRDPERNNGSRAVVLRERRGSVWALAAAALFLVAALGTAWLILSQRNPGGTDPSIIQADTPGGSEDTMKAVPPETSDRTAASDDPEYNKLKLDFDAMLKAADSDALRSVCEYIQNQTPSRKNEMTGLFAGKNLILITAQNFSTYVIDPERTPTLYRLATQGIEFTDYYQPAWGGTSSGEFAFLTGLVPSNGVQSMQDAVGKTMCLTLGNQLRQRGYFSRAYTNYFSFDYEHQDLTLPNLGYDELLGIGNGLDLVMTKQWPYSDREMMEVVIAQIDVMEPFSVYCKTCSGIGVYDVWANKMAEKHWSEVENLPYSDKVKGYFAANLEVEYALRDLVAALEDAGIADETVIVLSSSEYPYALEKDEDYGNFEDYLGELYGKPVENCFERDHSALIIWSGCLEGKGYQVTTPTCGFDIVPTLSNLFGLDYDSRLLAGRDVFSDQEPLVFWPDGSWKTDKYSYNQDTRVYSSADGTDITYDYAMEHHHAVEDKISFSKTVLETDLYALLRFSEE